MKALKEEFIPKFFGLLRTYEIYPETNETSIKTRKEFLQLFFNILKEEFSNDIVLEVYANHFLLNNILIKPESSTVILFERLLIRMKMLNILRLKILNTLKEEELLDFLLSYVEAYQNPKKAKKFLSLSFPSINFWGKESIEDYEEKTYIASLSNFLDVLSKMLVSHSHNFEQLLKLNIIDFLNIRRAVQEFISSIIEIGDKSLAFLVLGLNEKSEAVHGVLRAILGINFGLFLGFPLWAIEELVFLCLFSTIGLEKISRDLLNKKEELNEKEKSMIAKTGFIGYEILLKMKTLTPSTALLINSSIALSSKDDPKNSFFEIFNIIRTYESLIQNKPYRACFHPVKAMEIMWKERKKYKREDFLCNFFYFLTKEPIGSTWLNEEGNLITVFSKNDYRVFLGDKWEKKDTKPKEPLPLYKIKINPLNAFIGWI